MLKTNKHTGHVTAAPATRRGSRKEYLNRLTVADGTDFHLTVPSAHQYYLLWITQLPTGRQSVQINEVRATSS